MSFGEAMFWGNVIRGNVIWGNFVQGNVVWGNVVWETSFGEPALYQKVHTWVANRVTGMGEFTLVGQLLTLGSFFQLQK
jgi:hypothetical protein